MSFSRTTLASKTYEMKFNEAHYFERTKRNHYWLGGREGQLKLKDLRIGVAGLGGMGSNLAEIFVRLGVGHIKIADPDTIDWSNLNRQVIANRETVGQRKSHASANELRKIAEDFELVVYDEGITEENSAEFVSDLDIVIDEIDVFPFTPHIWLQREARKRNLPCYTGFIIGMGTHIFKFQGAGYTFEDFMMNDSKQIAAPTPDFMIDRLAFPLASYLEDPKNLSDFKKTIEDRAVPIFGASTYGSHSIIAIRAIVDFLGLDAKWGGPKTPTMPEFIKLDPYDLTLKVCRV